MDMCNSTWLLGTDSTIIDVQNNIVHFEKCNRKDFGRFEWYKNLAAKPQLVPRGLLYVPHYELPTYGKRSFAYAGPAM